MKKISALFLISIILFSFFTGIAATDNAVEISNEKELAKFFENGGKGKLTADIVLNGQYDIYSSSNIPI